MLGAVVAIFGFSLVPLVQTFECGDVSLCRLAALQAASREDFETFHDLAWRAVQKGRPNDPELMALVARAQSLSGRPGDALVMIRRLVQMGVATDAATSDDFRRVRALPGWPEVEAMMKGETPTPAAPPSPTEARRTPLPDAAAKAARPAAADAAVATAPPFEDESLPLPLASIEPAGLVHDNVSRRFIVGDRRENKLVIFDEVFKRATDMVGADSAGFFGLRALEIDARRGDLWVANSNAVRGAVLHKLQLVSGRVLFELAVPAELGPAAVVDLAVLPDGEVLLLDAQGRRLLGVPPARRVFERRAAADVDGATSVSSNGGRVAYVAHRDGILRIDIDTRHTARVPNAPGGLQRIRWDGRALIGVQSAGGANRLVRVRLDPAGRKVTGVDVLDASATIADPSGMTIADGVVYYITSAGGSSAMRRVKTRR